MSHDIGPKEHPFQGESAATLLAEAGQKFVSKDAWTSFLEGMFLITAKDALCAIDDVQNQNVANAQAGLNAQARALAFLFLVKSTKGEARVQERSAEAEVSGASSEGQNEARDVPQAPKRNRGKAATKATAPQEGH